MTGVTSWDLCCARDRTQGFLHSQQALYLLSYKPCYYFACSKCFYLSFWFFCLTQDRNQERQEHHTNKAFLGLMHDWYTHRTLQLLIKDARSKSLQTRRQMDTVHCTGLQDSSHNLSVLQPRPMLILSLTWQSGHIHCFESMSSSQKMVEILTTVTLRKIIIYWSSSDKLPMPIITRKCRGGTTAPVHGHSPL